MNRFKSRHERRKHRTRQSLLDAARRLIAERGYDATGVQDITDAADVSKGTFYHHFKDKEALTRTLIQQGFDALRKQLQATNAADDIFKHVQETLHTVFQHAAENRDLYRIMLGRQASAELNQMAIHTFTAVVEAIIQSRDLPPDTPPYMPALLANFITGAGVRLGMWWIDDDHGLSPEEISIIAYKLFSQGTLSLLPEER